MENNFIKTEGNPIIKDNPKGLTLKDLEKTFDEITNKLKKQTEKETEFYRTCLDKGFIKENNLTLNFCTNEKCESCRTLQAAIRREFKEWKAKDHLTK
jgi:hypothetical protein